MTLPKQFIECDVDLPIPEESLAQRDPSKWANQRFTIGTRRCRLINTRVYRFFRETTFSDSRIFTKDEFISAIFTPKEKKQFAQPRTIGRYIVNAVDYKPVFQRRRKNQPTVMCWQFHSSDDIMWGTAVQICVWLPDFLYRVTNGEVTPDNFNAMEELDAIANMSEDELNSLIINVPGLPADGDSEDEE